MSLKYVITHGINQHGSGYKVVRRIEVGVYAPYFSYFLRGGYGGLPPDEKPSNCLKLNAIRNHTLYKSHEVTKVKSRYFARAINDQIYYAGIHLWLNEAYAKERLHVLRVLDDDPNLVLVKFRWSGPIARDEDTVVATYATPLREIEVERIFITEEF